MASTDAETFEGRFWIPAEPHRSYGRVDYDHEHGVRLHLVDSNLLEPDPSGFPSPRPVSVLHAETLAGQPVTLLDFQPTHWSQHRFGPGVGNVVDAIAGLLLRGVHATSAEEVVVPIATATSAGLREFLTGGQVDRGLRWPTRQFPEPAEVLGVPIGKGAKLLLAAERMPTAYGVVQTTEIRASAQWTFDPPLPLPVVQRDLVSVLQDLVLFATRRQSFTLGLGIHFPDPRRGAIQVLERPWPSPQEQRDVYALTVNLANHDDPAGLIANWFELRRRVGPVWTVFFAALDRSEPLLQDRLLGLLAFAEGYHRALHDSPPLTPKQQKEAEKAISAAIEDNDVRRIYREATAHANSQTQRDRLSVLTRRRLDVLGEWWSVDEEVFTSRLIHTRNWLVHWGSRQRHVVEDTDGLIQLLRGLILVLYVNVLLDLGLSAEGAASAIGSGGGSRDPQIPLSTSTRTASRASRAAASPLNTRRLSRR